MDYSNLAISASARLREWTGHESGLVYLQRAKARIRDSWKWSQGHDVLSGKCSIARALEMEGDGGPGYESAVKALRAVTGGDPQRWNGRFWRTHASALRALDRAMQIELRR